MAGRFLSIDEVAARLGVDVDEVNRLVDRKKLFSIRDGATLKFKTEEVERVAESLGEESGFEASESIELDLDTADPAGSGPRTGSGLAGTASGLELAGDEWALGNPDGDGVDGSRTILGADVAPAADASSPALAGPGDDEAVSLFDDGGDDLLLESVVSASSPSLPAIDEFAIDDAADKTIELPGAAGPAASGMAGLSDASAIGAALSGPLESGLSLEDGDIKGSGIDLEIGSGIGGSGIGAGLGDSGIDLGGVSGIAASGIGGASGIAASGIGISGIGGPGSLVGEEFDLGTGNDDSESGSVVVATESTGDSSFFGGLDDSASVSFDESAASSLDVPALAGSGDFDFAIETPFNAWQIVGLVCCSLLLLFAGLVMFDLAWTIRSPGGGSFAAPLISGLAQTFGWQ